MISRLKVVLLCFFCLSHTGLLMRHPSLTILGERSGPPGVFGSESGEAKDPHPGPAHSQTGMERSDLGICHVLSIFTRAPRTRF